MTQFTLGINNCFAVKRWPEPEAWAAIVRERLGLDTVQYCLDLTELALEPAVLAKRAGRVRQACDDNGLTIHSGFTGLSAYNSNLLLSPDPAERRWALTWYRRALEFTARLGGRMAGGHLGAMTMAEYHHPELRAQRLAGLVEAVAGLSAAAWELGLECLLLEPMPVARELTGTLADTAALLTELNRSAALPVRLCPDLGHACATGNRGEDCDPLAWLKRFGHLSPVVHLQQTDGRSDAHHAFTAEHNASGIISASAVLDALRESGATETTLVLEVIHPYEYDEERVLAELADSVGYWQSALAGDAG